MTREGQDKIRDMVTGRMIGALEAGTVPWHKPWRGADGTIGLPMRMSNNHPYRGVNVWILGLTAMSMGYTSPWWGTYDQIAKLSGMVQEPMIRGGQPVLIKSGPNKGKPRLHWVSPDGTPRGVRQGEESTMVVLNKRFTYEDRNDLDEQGKPKRKAGYTMRFYYVFNASQAQQLPARFYPDESTEPQPQVEVESIEEIDLMLKTYTAALAGGWTHNRDGRAWYRWSTDQINTPPAEDYESMAERYSTEFHEMGHSTGHPSRLNRKGITQWAGHGSEPYADEELVAEMTSALLCAYQGIEGAFDNSASYIAGWLRRLRDDNSLVITAAARAQRAADLVMGVTFDDEEGSE